MVIIGQMSYPPESTKEMAKRFLELPEIPPYLNRKGPYVGANVSEGVSIFVVYELENSKLAEGMDFITNFYTNFFGVPGFKYQITPHFEIAEALKMIGLG